MKLMITAALLLPLGSAWAIETSPLEHLPLTRVVLGQEGYLADQRGLSLYTFDKDPVGQSVCYDECARKWPPALAAREALKPEAVKAGFGLVERKDGGYQWSYRGKPLYRWFKDTEPGQSSGDGVLQVWHRVPL